MDYIVKLNIKDRLCVIIGGGRAAYIKAKRLSECGGKIRIIAPDICDELYGIKAEIIKRKYIKTDIINAFIVFSLTDNEFLNKEINNSAKASGCLIGGEDFSVSAAYSGRNMSAAVNTGIPKLSAELAKMLLKYDDICGKLKEYRNKLISENSPDKDILLEKAVSDLLQSV